MSDGEISIEYVIGNGCDNDVEGGTGTIPKVQNSCIDDLAHGCAPEEAGTVSLAYFEGYNPVIGTRSLIGKGTVAEVAGLRYHTHAEQRNQ